MGRVRDLVLGVGLWGPHSVTFVEDVKEGSTRQSRTNVEAGVPCRLRRRCGQALVKTGTLASESETTGLAMMVGNRYMGTWLFYADSR